ncbi:MAG: NAD(P)/FAD-dependent oxidoreductase [Candidatus Nanoarchaeia archaeon]
MYDVAILGGGPAGVTAAVYCARYNLKTLLISNNIGGWVNNAYVIENLPSQKSIYGSELGKSYKEQLKANGVEVKKEAALTIRKEKDFHIETSKNSYTAHYIIYALGTKKRMLNVGESRFLGQGVHTCATCDAPFYRDETVAVIGGNDGGAKSALLLSEYAKNIYIIELMEKLPMEPALKQKILNHDKIDVFTGVCVKEFIGEEKLKGIKLTDGRELNIGGAFIEIGSDPNVEMARSAGVEIDKFNCINVDASQLTNVDRLYAAGDLTNNSNNLRQIVTAQAEGAVAAQAIYKRYLTKATNES